MKTIILQELVAKTFKGKEREEADIKKIAISCLTFYSSFWVKAAEHWGLSSSWHTSSFPVLTSHRESFARQDIALFRQWPHWEWCTDLQMIGPRSLCRTFCLKIDISQYHRQYKSRCNINMKLYHRQYRSRYILSENWFH